MIATQIVKTRRIIVPGQPRQKVCESPSQPMAGRKAMPLLSQLCGETQIGESQSRLVWA
jgi:hypothetical protein